MINDRNHGCPFLWSVVFPPWSPSSHTYMFGMERSLRELVIAGVGDVPVVLRLGDLYFIWPSLVWYGLSILCMCGDLDVWPAEVLMNSLACSFPIGDGFPIIVISYVFDFTFVIVGTVERASLGVGLLIQLILRYNQRVTYPRRILFGVSAFGIFKMTISRASFKCESFKSSLCLKRLCCYSSVSFLFLVPLFFSGFFLFFLCFIPLSSWFPTSSPSHWGSVWLTNILAKSSYYCRFCD